jgi:L-alanine-DL-glutamate epimerase-like enolase superfamily enzyme
VIDTDEGLQGLGEACSYGTPPRIAAEVERFRPSLLGWDPVDVMPPCPVGLNPPVDTAPACIDSALWDLRGKIAGKRLRRPARRRRDGHAHSAVRVGGGGNYDWENDPASGVTEALSYVEAGYTAFKMRIGTHWAWAVVTVALMLELLKAVTDAVDGRMELMLDGNQRLTEADALQVAHALSDWGWNWFEEPIPQTDIDGYARLNAAAAIRISGGEQYNTVEQFEPYLVNGAYAIVRQDVGWCGLTEGM